MSTTQARTLILLLAATCFVCGMLVMSTLQEASAETGTTDKTTQTIGDDTSNFVVPYDGYLMLDSTALNGTLDLQFKLYETASGGSAEWSETQTVTFYNGRFSVGLGSVTRINEDLLDADQLYLEIALDDGAGNLVTLSGRQAIEPVPYAIWSAHAANLNVAGSATIGGDATVSGTLKTNTLDDVSGGTVAVSAGLNATGGVTAASLTTTGALSAGSVTSTGALTVNGNTALGDGTSDTVTTTGAVSVGGNLTVSGNTTLGDATSDTLTINGTTTTNGAVVIGNSATTNRWLHVTGTDLYLGTSNSSGRGDGGRALIQGNGDTLYVNYNGDFSGGTVINSDAILSGDLTVNGNNIDSDSGVLGLNLAADAPIRVHVDTTDTAMTTGNEADGYYLSGSLGGTNCQSSTRGSLLVARVGNTDHDGLCYCAYDGSSQYRWICFEP